MSILNVKYAVTNASCTAFIYLKLGRPEECFIPMISGMSDSVQGALSIIDTFRRGVAKQILRARKDLDDVKNSTAPYASQYRPERLKRHEDWIKKLEAMETAVYHVVQISPVVVA